MKSKMISLLLAFSLLLACGACDSSDKPISVNTTPVVAVEAESDCMPAAEEFCKAKGYDMIECGSSEDAVIFVENGKYDYVVLDEFTSIIPEDYNLRLVETCSYSVEYCMCFYGDNVELQDGINGTIIDLKSDGTIDSIVENYFNGTGNDISASSGTPVRIICFPYVDDRVYFDEDGSICGVDVDIMTAICRERGYSPIFISAEYNEMFSMLEEGYGDLILMADASASYDSSLYTLSEVYLEKNYYVYESNVK